MRAPLFSVAITAAIGLSLWLAAPLNVTAQARFHVLSSQALDGIRDLQVVTVRDEATARCYAAFVLGANAEPVPVPESAEPWPSVNTDKIRLATALKDLIARRDRAVVDLRARSSNAWVVNYETARQEIEDEYERAVRDLLPELYPSAQVAPGWPTTSSDELDATVRRTIVEGEAEEAAQARTAANSQLLGAFTFNRPALAVVGPVACERPKN